jgi:hypothetical protein
MNTVPVMSERSERIMGSVVKAREHAERSEAGE